MGLQETIFEKNVSILVKKMTNKYGFMITHKEVAKELLSNRKESNVRLISKFVCNNGMLNGTLCFKKQ